MSDQSARTWLPADWLDEMNPTLLDSPDAFIEREGEGWALRLPEGDDERDNKFYRTLIEPGQVVLFFWTQSHGELSVTVHADGSFTTHDPIPAEATHFYECSSEMLADTLAELVAGDERLGNDGLEPGEYVVSTYTWSDPVPFRFEVDAEGRHGRFVSCAGAN